MKLGVSKRRVKDQKLESSKNPFKLEIYEVCYIINITKSSMEKSISIADEKGLIGWLKDRQLAGEDLISTSWKNCALKWIINKRSR